MDHKIIIRRVTTADAEQLRDHARKVLIENADRMGTSLNEFNVTIEEEIEWIRSHEKQGVIFAAEIDGMIIGMIKFRLSSLEKFSHQGLFGMSIQEAYTNQGIGRRLLEQLFDWAKQDDRVEKISLEVFADNDRAIHLYKKMGFVEEGRKVRHVKLGPDRYVDELLMGKFL
ncbi:GNAT family N-acetyltransferase [Jeotgalibacillus terrae]|uniref:GNAT family N-acetyltransferase n=1 Tax=Jeotgalibacillus terrae TaxID=587735 RepID=A0ABW5ZHN7_9BACL|nr:GNAT family N-acetyltransferase [Jeotgalibacillus terrae]MBM7578739.1 RimJ/RimL family protein N-acetyltransferase [Jeotgalibacillus terrae]